MRVAIAVGLLMIGAGLTAVAGYIIGCRLQPEEFAYVAAAVVATITLGVVALLVVFAK